MSSGPSASNSDLYVNGDPTFPVFDDGYSKFEVTEKRLDSDDVICLPASEVRAMCPDLMPKPMPRPVPGCPRYPPGGGGGGDWVVPGPGGRWPGDYDEPDYPPYPAPPRPPVVDQTGGVSRPNNMYHGRHVTAAGLKATRFNNFTLTSPNALGGRLGVTLARGKGNAITDIRLGAVRFLRAGNATSVTQTTMAFNVPVGYHTNVNKAAEGGYWRDAWDASTSVSLAQAVAGNNTVYTKTRAAFVRRPVDSVRGMRVLNRVRVSDIVMEKRIKMLGRNSFSYGVTLNYPPTAKFMTTRTAVVKSISPANFSRVTVLNKAGRWVAVPVTQRRRYLTVVSNQAMALSTPNGSHCIGLSLHDFPHSRAGNWFTPLTMYSVRRIPGGISWSLVQQLGKRDASTLGWARVGKQGPRVRRTFVLPGGKFSYGMTWSVGTMAQVQAALRKAAQTKGRQADTNVVDAVQVPGNKVKVCTVKKNLNQYCKNLKCKTNDQRGKCGVCMNCAMVKVTPKVVVDGKGKVKVCTVKKNLNQYCKNLKCKTNDPRGKCGVCMDCAMVKVKPAAPQAVVVNAKCTVKKNLNQYCKDLKCQTNDKRGKCGVCMDCTKKQKCTPLDIPVCAGCKVNDGRAKCEGCTTCV